MTRAQVQAAAGVGAVVLLLGAYSFGVRAGKLSAERDQAEKDLVVYQQIMEAINASTVDRSDDAAVLAELCRIAGIDQSDDLCTLSGDSRSESGAR